ncbi:MAG: adenylosuccinate lyase [Candidatus Schekmanbacteria bacterium]|nr:adenylosuccinate lyase [Candidatus Schekmanbacteria bacterium]
MIERYTLPEMARIWSEAFKLEHWLEVELAWLDVLAEKGVIPSEVPGLIRRQVHLDPARAAQIEEIVQHDVIAFLTSLSEQLGPEGRYLHYGLTSSDILDTALALQLREAGALIMRELDALVAVVAGQAWRHRDTVMIGRTHGVHAEPITLGFKLAGWHAELNRCRERLARAIRTVSVGKLSGAVGIHGTTDPEAEAEVLSRFGLKPEPVATQVVPRDRHAELMFALAAIGAALERIATEVRSLARPEIREVEEPFRQGQKGSSAMPHKRNPVLCERMAGMARLLRGNLTVALENVALWHERDISHSSAERIILPDSTILAHYMLRKLTRVIADMVVYPERMLANMTASHGLALSQRVLLALIAKGLSREAAYALVQRGAARCWDEGLDFQAVLDTDPEIRAMLSAQEIQACLDLGAHLSHVHGILDRAGIKSPAAPEE